MDQLTLQRIETLHPKWRPDVKKAYIEANNTLGKGSRLRFSYTSRSWALQTALYAQGRESLAEINRLRKIAGVDAISASEAKIIVTNAKAGESYHNYGLACFDDKTKVFTNEGLKYLSELTGSEEVLTFKNDLLEYQKPLAFISNDYEGEMVHLKSRSVDMMVTPNHKLVVKKRTNGLWDKEWKEIDASELNYRYKIPTTGSSIHRELSLPEINTYNVPFRFDEINTEDWWEFMGYWLSEGSACGTSDGIPRKHNNRYAVKISQSKDKNPFVWEKIYSCLTRMGFRFFYSGHDFTINNKGLWEYLFKIGNSGQKYIPEYLLKADQKHLEKLYFALVDGDGSYYDNGESYGSVSKKLAEGFLTLSILLNKSAVITSRKGTKKTIMPHGEYQKSEIKRFYVVRTRTSTTHEIRNGSSKPLINKVYYKGVVYCVTTSAGALVIERNGKVCVSGNCDIVILYDNDGNGSFEEPSWSVTRDFDKDGVADWLEVTKVFTKYGFQNGFIKNGKKWDLPHFQKTFNYTIKQLQEKYRKKDFIPGTNFLNL